jgi:TolB protein
LQGTGDPPVVVLPPPPPDPTANLLRLTPFGGKHELLYPCLLPGRSSLFLLHPDARVPINLTPDQNRSTLPAYSPDGKRIAFTCEVQGKLQICVMDEGGKNVRQLTEEPGYNRAPAWSPDGKRIAFISNRDRNSEVYVMDADGANPVNLTNDPGFDGDPAWSPDGKQIAFVSGRTEDKALCLCVMDADGNNVRDLKVNISRAGYVYPAWSPDGKRIAYAGTADKALEVFVYDTAGGAPTQLTSLGGANGMPAWSPDGKRIAFQHTPAGGQLASLYVMNADGTSPTVILAAAGLREGGRPAWKPR